jgi:pimeloyl-ACP methyl ester carboxylesterase
MKITLIILIVGIVIYITICVLLYLFQEKYVFYPSHEIRIIPAEYNLKSLKLKTPDNCILDAYWLENDPSAKTVLFFHGNAGNITYSEERVKLFKELGVNALLIEYRGYGRSTGKIQKEEDIYTDGETGYRYLTETLQIPENKIIIWGWSMGGAVATEISTRKNASLTILEGTFYSLFDIANRTFWMFPLKSLSRYKFTSGEKLNKIKSPIIFIHSPDDETIPYSQGEKNFKAFNGEKYFVTSKGDHNKGVFESKDAIFPVIKKFL